MARSKRTVTKAAKGVARRSSSRPLRSLANTIPVDVLAALTGRAESTIRLALRQGPSKRLAGDLAILRREVFGSAPKPAARKKPAKKPALKKPAPKKPAPKKPVPKKPAPKKPVPKKPEPKKPALKKPEPKKPVPKKPVLKKPVSKKPEPKKPAPKKPVSKKPEPKKLAPKKPAPKKPVPKKPVPKKPKKRKKPRRFPSFMARAAAAETMMVEKLTSLNEAVIEGSPGLDVSVKTFINADGMVDGELRLRDLPDDWRTVEGMPLLVEAFSNAFRAVGAFPERLSMGGAFWISCGLRFGPKDQAELEQIAKFYKRFRGLLQVGAYSSSAQFLPAMLNNLLAIRMLVERVWARRSLPPVQLLVRFTWTPTTEKPGRWKGEEGIKE